MRIILASASPRRRELLEQIGLKFDVKVSEVEEVISSTIPQEIVEQLATQKAEAVLDSLPDGTGQDPVLVIGADTIVSCDGNIMGKPKSPEHAVEMLRLLSGRTHQVYTGVSLYLKTAQGVESRHFHETTQVSFYDMSESEILSYVDTGDPMDKAGAYGIQGMCARFIRGIEGDYNNVVGLPVGRLYQEVKDWLSQEVEGFRT